jgi:anti-sigma factor RsiW
MDCEKASLKIRPWLDGELDSALAAELSEHLAGCRACLGRLQDDRRISRVLRAGAQVIPEPMPALDAGRILDRIQRAGREEAATIVFLRRAAAAAAIALMVGGIIIVSRASIGPGTANAQASIRNVAVPAVGMRLIDDRNSILIGIGRR